MKVGSAFTDFEIVGRNRVRAGAGLSVPCFVKKVVSSGLSIGSSISSVGLVDYFRRYRRLEQQIVRLPISEL